MPLKNARGSCAKRAMALPAMLAWRMTAPVGLVLEMPVLVMSAPERPALVRPVRPRLMMLVRTVLIVHWQEIARGVGRWRWMRRSLRCKS